MELAIAVVEDLIQWSTRRTRKQENAIGERDEPIGKAKRGNIPK